MINIEEAVIETLKKNFEDPVNDEISQSETKSPGFYVEMAKALYEREINDYHHHTYMIVIQYVQGKQGGSQKRWEVHAKLLELFRFYEALNLRPLSMVAEVKAGTLYFSVEFSIRYKITDGKDDHLLKGFEIRSGLKNA